MASLTGTKIKDTYDSLLKVSDNGALDGTLQTITDGLGNNSALSLSTAGASVGGTLAVSGAATLSSTLGVTGAVNIISGNILLVQNKIDGSTDNLKISSDYNNVSGASTIEFLVDGTERMRVANSGDISFRDSSANEAFYWDASAAKLGIGTVIPSSGISTSSKTLHISDANLASISLDNTTQNAKFELASIDVSGGALSVRKNTSIGTSGATELMRIDSSGNVGIGESSPTAVSSGATTLNIKGTSTTKGGAIVLKSSDASVSSYLYPDSTSGLTIGTSTNHQMRFMTNATERMRITSGGFLKVSNSGTYVSATASYHELRNNSNVSGDQVLVSQLGSNCNNTSSYFYIANTGGVDKLYIYGNGNIVNANNSYGALSDAKIKENVVDASPKLEDLMQVQVRNFNYIGDDKKQIGVVAQELEQVFPSMIDESPDFEEVEVPQLDENGQEVLDENGEVVMTKERVDLVTVTKSVKYSVFVPMLIKAMQEQQEIINDLKSRIEQLEA